MSEHLGEGRLELAVDLGERQVPAEPGERGDRVAGEPAGHDPLEMAEVGRDVQRDAVIGDPMAHPHADRGDLGLATFRRLDPHADPPGPPAGLDAEPGEGADHPLLEPVDVAAQVAAAPLEVEQNVGHPLAGPMIGEATAAAGLEHREAVRIEELGRVGAGAGGIKRRVLEQPDELARPTGADRLDPFLHRRHRQGVGHEVARPAPLQR